MSLTNILNTMSRCDVIADFNLNSLEGQSIMGRRDEIKLMAIPFFKNILTPQIPDPDWMIALESYGLKPNPILDQDVKIEGAIRATMTPQFQEGDPFFDLSQETFDELYSKEFLYFSPHGLNVPQAVRGDQYKDGHQFSDGFLIRKSKSAQGSGIKLVKDLESLEEDLISKSDIIVEYYPQFRVQKNIEVIMSYQDGVAQILGITEVISKNFKKIGSKSTQLSDEQLNKLQDEISKIEKLLKLKAVKKLHFGLDAFFIHDQSEGGKLVIYDFNPCITQGFFPIIAKSFLENTWGPNFNYEVRAFSIFSKSTAPLPFDWTNAFPLFISKHNEKGALFTRYIVIALFPYLTKNDSQSPGLLWAENLKAHPSKLLHLYTAIHY